MIRLSGVITYSFPMQDTFPFPWLAVYQNIDIPLSIADLIQPYLVQVTRF